MLLVCVVGSGNTTLICTDCRIAPSGSATDIRDMNRGLLLLLGKVSIRTISKSYEHHIKRFPFFSACLQYSQSKSRLKPRCADSLVNRELHMWFGARTARCIHNHHCSELLSLSLSNVWFWKSVWMENFIEKYYNTWLSTWLHLYSAISLGSGAHVQEGLDTDRSTSLTFIIIINSLSVDRLLITSCSKSTIASGCLVGTEMNRLQQHQWATMLVQRQRSFDQWRVGKRRFVTITSRSQIQALKISSTRFFYAYGTGYPLLTGWPEKACGESNRKIFPRSITSWSK